MVPNEIQLFLSFSMKELEKDMAMLRNGMKEVGREVEFYRTQPPVNGDRYVNLHWKWCFLSILESSNLSYFLKPTGEQKSLKMPNPLAICTQFLQFSSLKYSMPSTITCPWFETALNYKPRILDPKIEEFPCLVHKLSVQTSISTNTNRSTYNINRSEKWGKKYTNHRL